jgi:ElaB/YqjD/DUF883 family membrane-anchored ribosome-binding protein
MADQAFTEKSTSGPAPHGFESAARTAETTADQAQSAGRDLKDKAADLATSSAEAIKDQASEFVDAAKDLGSQATDRVKKTVVDQKDAGARYVSGIAEAMRRAAREFDNDLPIAGTYMRKAASQVETVSDSVKNGDFSDLVRNAQNFVRRQPTAVLGTAVLAGFGIVRFLKSSAEHSDGAGGDRISNQGIRQDGRDHQTNTLGYRDDFSK